MSAYSSVFGFELVRSLIGLDIYLKRYFLSVGMIIWFC